MQTRAFSVFYILLSYAMGMALLFSPWSPGWTANYFVQHFAWVSALAGNDYMRGAISGAGLANFGLASYELARLRRPAEPVSEHTLHQQP